MGIELNVYVKSIDDSFIPMWMERLNAFDMECDFHPAFSFDDQEGFLPFKVKFKTPTNPILKDRTFIAGYEFYKGTFDLQKELVANQPKQTFIQKMLKRHAGITYFANPEIDARLRPCKWVLNLNWGSHNSLELRMALLSSAILTEITNGVCHYPADDIWYDNKTVVEDAYNEILEFENSLSPKDWILHDFNGWGE